MVDYYVIKKVIADLFMNKKDESELGDDDIII